VINVTSRGVSMQSSHVRQRIEIDRPMSHMVPDTFFAA
jgi:hypothetical protein